MDDVDADIDADADDDISLDELAAVAEQAVRAGGEFLRDEFRDGTVDGEYGTDDVKAAADRAAEERVVSVIRESFPGHALHAEEGGRSGSNRYEWVVDPLDGTNNFAAGLPMFASAVAVLDDGVPVTSAIYEPLPETLYLARRNHGVTVNGERIQSSKSDLPLEHGTVSFVLGLPALRDAERRERSEEILDSLDGVCKRVLETWSPCVDWGLLATGRIEGLVAYYPDVYEQHAGSLLAAEAGVEFVESEETYVAAGDDATLEAILHALPAEARP
ncbi:inositol monophosphatase [Haloprofundus marisrubri]|uniref:fructose-bisphosphatase n=1 Tax=Haloprofundus marisrubri TaxID=1514971 RepID=A0A0W1R934_9EURY|nr:inositol monophosphatase family protein [Haloprofundus marisrubri]KTG10073.1 inositol monophosphatase [Haloprofundus marisrubri]